MGRSFTSLNRSHVSLIKLVEGLGQQRPLFGKSSSSCRHLLCDRDENSHISLSCQCSSTVAGHLRSFRTAFPGIKLCDMVRNNLSVMILNQMKTREVIVNTNLNKKRLSNLVGLDTGD